MQISRLFAITYLLLEHGTMTAAKLASRLEVSVRTIYRDIEILSGAGIPVYCVKGKGGGIRIMPEFTLQRSFLSQQEQQEILDALKALQVTGQPSSGMALTKLKALFHRENTDWVTVDFGGWGPNETLFSKLKSAIFQQKRIRFTYYSSHGGVLQRTVEPLQLCFKGRSWYLSAYCLYRQDYRLFKLTRIKQCALLEEPFSRPLPAPLFSTEESLPPIPVVHLKLRAEPCLAYRVYDEFEPQQITEQPDGSFLIEVSYPEDAWVPGFLLSFGPSLVVLEPARLRKTIREKLRLALNRYENTEKSEDRTKPS